jgi:ATP-dependent protease ClpP protease subunit
VSKKATPTIRTRAQVKAQAKALVGDKSRVARASTGDDPAAGPETGTTGELWLYGVVGGWWRGFDAESVSKALRGMDVDTLYVRIHSPGGLASDGIAIGNLLRNHKANVIAVVDGLAASAASVIAIAADEVIMCPGSQMMLHDASTYGYGNAADLRQAADWIDGQSQNYAGVYAYKAGGTDAQWREVMQANDGWGTWYTADEAVAAALADKVGTVVAVGSPPTAPEDQLDEDDDGWAKAAHDLELLEQCVHPAARAAWQGERPKPPSASAVGSPKTEGGTAVDFTDEQLTTMRDALELPETADEAAIVAAVTAVVAENVEERSASIPEGHVVVPKAKLADLESGATAGLAAAKKLHEQERESFLDANKAKYAATNRAAWADEYDRNPEGTRAHFAKAPDLVPVTEHGHAVDADGDDTTAQSLDDVRSDPAYQNWRM